MLHPEIRVKLRFLQQKLICLLNGQHTLLVQKNAKIIDYPIQISLSQPIKSNPHTSNKLENLKIASSLINNKVIEPGQIFSFWNLIPRPTSKNGFKLGRNLIGSGLSLDYGGGLCQLSGIFYHLSLVAGLEIIERHPHSKDIYTKQTRYTPLGSDATVVYGYKDLKIKNNLDQVICFRIELEPHEIIAHICAINPIRRLTISFESEEEGDFQISKVYIVSDQKRSIISTNRYEKLYKE